MANKLSFRNRLAVVTAAICASLMTTPSWCADYVRHGNQVTCGQTRFEVLSPSLVRMQYASSGFSDAATAVITNRSMSSIDFTAAVKDGWLQIVTPKMLIQYRVGSGSFNSENLRAVAQKTAQHYEWTWGIYDDKNLGGPMQSFNSMYEQTMPTNQLPGFPDGFLSRNGFCFYDDSKTPLWDTKSQWITPQTSKDSQDWYLFVYGKDYKQFFKDYIALSGRIPMAPRYVLGAWITDVNFEYTGQKMDENYLWGLVERFRKEHIPLDVFVFDFGWHLYGWDGGLDWSPVFSNPEAFLAKLEKAGIKTSANDHPSSGLSLQDTRIDDARAKLGLQPLKDRKLIDLSTNWLFQTDPTNIGVGKGWSKPELDDSSWEKQQQAGVWEYAGHAGYDGYAWYRKWVDIPANMLSDKEYITFGGVDDEYELYINGELAAQYAWEIPGGTVYSTTTTTEVAKLLKPGRNLIALHIKDNGHNGGFTKAPQMLSSEPYNSRSMTFNLANKAEAKVYTDYLNGVIDQGLDFWWIDGDFAQMDGLNSQMWTNRMYYTATEEHTGKRSFIFSRYGGPGSHRYPGFFTGDAVSTWKVLKYEIPMTVKSGNVLYPYVTHDIGGFVGTLKDNYELYARWVQFGAFSPIFRLHSCHENPDEGNARMPWNYGDKGLNLARQFVTARYQLIPYIYTYCREAYDTGLPMCRPLYIEYPDRDEAYNHFDEYLLGREMLIAPVTTPAVNGQAIRDIYFPEGVWIDYFTGVKYQGNKTIKYTCPLDRMPVFVKQGSILPKQPDMEYSNQKPVDPLILDIYPGSDAAFKLYEDDGTSLNYTKDAFARTNLNMEMTSPKSLTVTIAATVGHYDGQLQKRGYKLEVHLPSKPKTVKLQGKLTPCQWDAKSGTAVISIVSSSIRTAKQIAIQW